MDNIENFSKGEEIANAVIHGIGAGLAIAGLVMLIIFAGFYGSPIAVVSFTIYGITLIILYLSSTLYHSFTHIKTKNIFEIFDHASIFLLIAGTYTPISLLVIRGWKGWTIFGIVWGLAVIGIIFKVFFVKKFVVLSTLLYIIMGWIVVIAFKELVMNFPKNGLLFLVLGGGLYTGGTIFYVWRKMKYHHALWHIFVLAGSIFHFFSILFYALPRK